MSLYKRGKVFHYDFAVHGDRYRGSTEMTVLSRARQVEAKLMMEAKERRLGIGKVPTLRDFAPVFMEWVEETNKLKKKTRSYYTTGWNMLEDTDLAGMRLTDITDDDVHRIKFKVVERVVEGYEILAPASPSTVNNALRTLRRMLRKAVEWKRAPFAPSIKLVEEHGRSLLLDTVAELKLMAVAKQPLRDVILAIRDAGMRPDEIFRMRLEFVHWDRRVYHNPDGKTKRARRVVPLSDRLLDMLKRRADNRTEGWVFPAKRSKSGHLSTVTKQFQQAREAAGLPRKLVLYCGRHDFATFALEETGNLAAVMSAMGHEATETAMKYQHPGLDAIREAVNARNQETLLRQPPVTEQPQ